MLENVVVRAANAKDIPSLLLLNKKWQKAALGNETGSGFLSGEITEDAFSVMIANNEVTVAEDSTGQIVAYQLISNTSNGIIISIHSNLVNSVEEKGLIAQNSRVGIGVQICVDKPYQGTGLKTKVFEQLRKQVAGKYDLLFSTVGKENERSYKAHKADGWDIIYETDTHYCILYRL